jgi:DNA-binding MarR family transcriptional regulator
LVNTGHAGHTHTVNTENGLDTQARALVALLPALGRSLLAVDPNHPITELPLAQLRVCTALQEGPCPLSTLADRLGLSPSSVTQISDRLERVHLVERVPEADDRRVKKLRLTECGEELMRSYREARIARLRGVLEKLSPRMREKVVEALSALVEAGEQMEEPCCTIGAPRPIE